MQRCAGWRVLLPAGCGTRDSEPPGLESRRPEDAAAWCRSPGRAAHRAGTRRLLAQSYAAQQILLLPLREEAHAPDQTRRQTPSMLGDHAALCSTDVSLHPS